MKRRFWIQRITYQAHISIPILEQGYLTCGYVDMALRKNFLDTLLTYSTDEEQKDYIGKVIHEEWGGSSRRRLQLWRFLCGIKTNDWVLVPAPGAFSIYEIIDDKPLRICDINEQIMNSDKQCVQRNQDNFLITKCENAHVQIIDLGFCRKIKLIHKNISRKNFADSALTSRLKVQQANVNIDDLQANILKSVQAHEANRPITIHRPIKEQVTTQIKTILEENVRPQVFENLIKWLFQKLGAKIIPSNTRHTPEDEGDIDIIAEFELLRTIYYIQAKNHKNKTNSDGLEQIKKFNTTENEKNTDGISRLYWLISTGSFTEECQLRARASNIILCDGEQFAEMLLNVGIHNIDEAFK